MNFGERMKKYSKKHGMWKYNDPTYYTWIRMRSRCNNPNERQYKHYGGRGIKICQRWESYANFFEDMGERPGNKLSLDRIDVNGDYCKENCRWTTWDVQLNNKRTNKSHTFNGKTMNQSQWAREVGIGFDTLSWRLRHGWSLERALTEKP